MVEEPCRPGIAYGDVVRFAFYGRVSTEDQQDPGASREWQLSRARAVIESVAGRIVTEFFDVGRSRALPWKRRPQAARLLEALQQPDRGFEAVVIGEPQRAFYGNQFGLTFPLFDHYGVQLWVPEIGGAIDPGSDAHDLVMALYGGMSKGERNRVKIRVRSAMAAQTATEGRFLGGRPPYGYRLADAGPHPNPAKAADGRRLHKLEPDPVTAPVVTRIFTEYLQGAGINAIARGLVSDGIPSPSAYDRARNSHRSGVGWSPGAVRAILLNPRYTGRQVWNRQRKDEVLIDVNDVALGHEPKLRWNPTEAWIWSDDLAHQPLITATQFEQVQVLQAPGGRRRAAHKPHRSLHPYPLRGMIYCGICGRRMTGHWVNGQTYYRCDYRRQYALPDAVEHPRTINLRESLLLPTLEAWLEQAFGPKNLASTIEAAVRDHGPGSPGDASIAKALRDNLRNCHHRLARYRLALESGTNPELVAQWAADTNAERVITENQLAQLTDRIRSVEQDIEALVAAFREVINMPRLNTPEATAGFYEQLGLRATYYLATDTLHVAALPNSWRLALPTSFADSGIRSIGDASFRLGTGTRTSPGVMSPTRPSEIN